MSKLGMLLLMLASTTFAWAGPGSQDDENQPCMITTGAGTHKCTPAEDALLIARQRQIRELYRPRPTGQVDTRQEPGRALLRLLGPRAAETQRGPDPVKTGAEKLRQLLDAAGATASDKPAAPKQ